MSSRGVRKKEGRRDRPDIHQTAPASKSSQATGGRRWIHAILGLITLGGCAFLAADWTGLWRDGSGQARSTSSPASSANNIQLPKLELTTDQDGVQHAIFPGERLEAFCRDRGLPVPPDLQGTEAGVAARLFEALEQAGSVPSAENLGRLGQIYESINCHETAAICFERAHELAPSDYRWCYYLGTIADLLGRHEDALQWFERVRKLKPDYPTTYARLGIARLDEQDYGATKALWDKYMELQPHDCLGYVGLGRVAMGSGDYPRAIELLRKAVELLPIDYQSHYYLGRAYAALGDREKAEQEMDLSARLPRGRIWKVRDPLLQEIMKVSNSIEGLEFDLTLLQNSQEWDKLSPIVEEILRRRAGDTGMMANLAGIYAKQGRSEEAQSLMRRAIALRPDSPALYATQAKVLLMQRQAQPALEAANKALALDSTHAPAIDLKARAMFLLGRFDEAIERSREYLAGQPEAPDIVYILAESLYQTRQLPQAGDEFRRLLELQPGHQQALARLAELDKKQLP